MQNNRYIDTRGSIAEPINFSEAIVKGIAPGGGLFVPQNIPKLSIDEIITLGELSYADQAAKVYSAFGVDFEASEVEVLMQQAYGSKFDIDSVAPVRAVAPGTHVLELWHGPTSAFKDMALQCLPVFFSAAIDKLRAQGNDASDYLILVATSGDTGKAALEGFANKEHASIIVFYPDGGVSDVQFLQMATQRGSNVGVFGVRGNFDDCQSAVKAAFSDRAFNAELERERDLRLSSANSINWGRLLPQVVYYISAYAQMVAAGSVAPGSPIDVCVPTGNFGNILAAYYAKLLGAPIERLLCASNDNRVLADFINTGVYDIREREFILTPSPSMDILVSSNLERQLFELTGRNASAVAGWMQELRDNRYFKVDIDTFANLRAHFSADWVSADESLATIRAVYKEYGYLLDPHTAVAWQVGERYRDLAVDVGGRPLLVVSTAHWAKFGADVYRALNEIAPGEALPTEIEQIGGVALNDLIASKYPNAGDVPAGLSNLSASDIRFEDVVAGSTSGIQSAVRDWLGL